MRNNYILGESTMELKLRKIKMPRFSLIFGILLFVTFFISCEKDHEKIASKMLLAATEDSCTELVDAIGEEIQENDYYVWNGEKCELNVTGELENQLNSLIALHKVKHSFANKKGIVDEKKWADWMYYYNTSDENENSESLYTDCFLCLEKNSSEDKTQFDNELDNCSKSFLLYSSYFGNKIKEKEESLTSLHNQLKWMEKCTISMSNFIWDEAKTINDLYKDMPKSVKVTKSIKGNNLIVRASAQVEGDEVLSVAAAFVCSKIGSAGSCWISEVSMTSLGQTIKSKCRGGFFNDPSGAGECMGMLSTALDGLKGFK